MENTEDYTKKIKIKIFISLNLPDLNETLNLALNKGNVLLTDKNIFKRCKK